MGDMVLGRQIGGTYATQQDAQRAAEAHQGNEAIVRTEDGRFIVRELNADQTAMQAITQQAAQFHQFGTSDLDPNVVSFSLAGANGQSDQAVGVVHLEQAIGQMKPMVLESLKGLSGPALQQQLNNIETWVDQLMAFVQRDGHVNASERRAMADLADALHQRLLGTVSPNPANQAMLDTCRQHLATKFRPIVDLDAGEGAHTVTPATVSSDTRLPGSQVVGDRFADPEAMLADISQMDRFDQTTSDAHRCGIHAAVINPAIYRGPAALETIIQKLTANGQNPQLANINVRDGVSQREIALIGDALFTRAGGRPGHGLTLAQQRTVATEMGLSPGPEQRTPYTALASRMDQMHTGETMMWAVDSQTAAGSGAMAVATESAGKPNHAISVTKRDGYFVLNDPFHPQSEMRFASAQALVDYMQRSDTGRQLPATRTQLEWFLLPAPGAAAQTEARAAAGQYQVRVAGDPNYYRITPASGDRPATVTVSRPDMPQRPATPDEIAALRRATGALPESALHGVGQYEITGALISAQGTPAAAQ